jgi:MFS superfamily sulfate permease-like transporter
MESSEIAAIAQRVEADTFLSLRHLPRRRVPGELLAGVTLLALAIPEQLATAHLGQLPAYVAMIGFVVATIVFAALGSNPILSVGADSTITPLFAMALIRLAVPASTHYLTLVALTACVAGICVALVGVCRLGWLADFLSVPIVTGFMVGVGCTIIVHQLPEALGVPSGSGSLTNRLTHLVAQRGHMQWLALALAAGTVLIVVACERWWPKLPGALVAVLGGTLLLRIVHWRHVALLGRSPAGGLTFRLAHATWTDALGVITTGVTVAVVIISQSAATSRSVADELGVSVNINRDFVALGLANMASGLVGALPVNASPARTSVVRASGGKTQLVALTAAAGAVVLVPFASVLRTLPLACLAGILFFVAGRLIKIGTLRSIARVSPWECALALATTVAVVLWGVQIGLAIAVALAIADQTRRSTRPRVLLLEREIGTTSWRPREKGRTERVDHVTVLLFGAALFFANADRFRHEVQQALREVPDTQHLVLDAASIVDIDYTGLTTLRALVDDLKREGITVVMARANEVTERAVRHAPAECVRTLAIFASVNEAVTACAT